MAGILLGYDIVVSIMLTTMFLYLIYENRVQTPTFLQRQKPDGKRLLSVVSIAKSWKPKFFSRIQDAEMLADADGDIESGSSGTGFDVLPAMDYDVPDQVDKSVRALTRKTLIGACLLCVPFTINPALLVALKGMETAWLCFMVCTLDSKLWHQTFPSVPRAPKSA